MSLAHIKLVKASESEELVVYTVMSPDFNRTQELEEIALIAINKARRSYTFSLGKIWANKKVVPPYVYDLDEDQMHALLTTQFVGYGYGAWTGRIMSQVKQMLKSGVFPAENP